MRQPLKQHGRFGKHTDEYLLEDRGTSRVGQHGVPAISNGTGNDVTIGSSVSKNKPLKCESPSKLPAPGLQDPPADLTDAVLAGMGDLHARPTQHAHTCTTRKKEKLNAMCMMRKELVDRMQLCTLDRCV